MRHRRLVLLAAVLLALTAVCEQSNTKEVLGEFLEAAKSAGIIDDTQLKNLNEFALQFSPQKSDTSSNEAAQEVGENTKRSAFMRLYDHLTLLNVLYFGGALLVMGAYTLFMTLALEKCDYAGLAFILIIQAVAFGVTGVLIWLRTEEYQFVGGL